MPEKGNVIYFEKPAENWHQGCLMGNGWMGQVLYGGVKTEIIDLSQITFFSGSSGENPCREGASEAFQRARAAAAAGDYHTAEEQTELFMGKRGNYGTNLPVGRLQIAFQEGNNTGQETGSVIKERNDCCFLPDADNDSEYRRYLDIDRGIAGCEMKHHSSVWSREAFCSHVDQVFALRLISRGPDAMDFRVSFDSLGKTSSVHAEEQTLFFETQALESLHSDGREGVSLRGKVRVCLQDGEMTSTGENLCVSGTHFAVLYLTMETDYALSEQGERVQKCWMPESRDFLLEDYENLRFKHMEDFKSFMGRQSLAIESEKSPKRELTARRLAEEARCGGDTRYLTQLMYQYGRYLLLSSSREDSPLPAPLQGVWNDNVACRIGWTCDMHLDINTQMNYWISEPGALPECHEPLFGWMEKRLIPNGRETAAQCYGMSGWVGELVSNAWGYAAPYWNKSLSPCPACGIWMASDYMEHYRYGQEKEFLECRTLPVIEEAVAFFLEYLFENEDGYYTGGPSVSPENSFLKEGERHYTSNGCTYEILMIRELFLEYEEICSELSIEGSYLSAVRERLPRLLPYRILADGSLAEWAHDYPAADPQHRHTSHLLGLYPYAQILRETSPGLAKAAEKSLKLKLTPYEKWEDTGWARSLLALYNARLGQGQEAYRHIRSMQEGLMEESLLVMHPPTRGAASFASVYELDGNTGFSMAVLEMLVQSHKGLIRLLPALPREWSDGKLKGVRLRGGLKMDMEWREEKPYRIEVCSNRLQRVDFAFKNRTVSRRVVVGEKIVLEAETWSDEQIR